MNIASYNSRPWFLKYNRLMVQTLSQIKALLDAHGLRPKHRFGQNFLHDAQKMEAILRDAAIQPGDLVLEVGPGTGALTTRLLAAGANVAMVEIDTDLAPILTTICHDHPGDPGHPGQAELLMGDILQGKHAINPDAIALLERMGLGTKHASFKLIANLPYHVASPLIANLVIDHPRMAGAVVMVQKEVAQRLMAKPGGKDYGQLGIIVQVMCHVKGVATLPPGCFWPPPSIDSMVVALTRREQPLTDQPHALSALLQKLFQQRRKQLGSILGRDRAFPDGISPQQRPEQLTLEQFIALARWHA